MRQLEAGLKGLLGRFWRSKSSFLAVAQTLVANVGIQAANFACGIVTARTLAPQGRGILTAVIMWPQFMAYSLSLGLPLAFIYWVRTKPELARQLSGASLVLCFFVGIFGAGCGWFLMPYSLHAYPPEVIRFAQWIVLLTPISLCTSIVVSQVQSSELFTHYNIFRILIPILVLAGLLTLAVTGTISAQRASLVYLMAGMPGLAWMLYVVWKKRKPAFHDLKPSIKLLLNYGLRAWGADLLGSVQSQVDRIMVVSLLNPSAMGIYVVSQSAAALLDVIPTAVSPVLLPRIAGRTRGEVIGTTGAAMRLTLGLMIAAGLPLALMGSFLFRLVYGSKFQQAGSILPFLVVEAILEGALTILAQAFLGAGMPGAITVLQGIGIAAGVGLAYVLVPLWGLQGAAAALLLATLVRVLVALAYFPVRLKTRPPSLILSRHEIMTFIRTRQLVSVQHDM